MLVPVTRALVRRGQRLDRASGCLEVFENTRTGCRGTGGEVLELWLNEQDPDGGRDGDDLDDWLRPTRCGIDREEHLLNLWIRE